MYEKKLKRLIKLVRSACTSVGIPPGEIKSSADGLVSIPGLGINLKWSPNALGEDRAGWSLFEEFDSVEIASATLKRSFRDVASFAPADIVLAAKSLALLAAERRIEATLDEVSVVDIDR